MGYYAELAMELRDERTHAAPEGDAFRACAEELAELCGLKADLSPEELMSFTAGTECTPGEFWDRDFSDHPMRSLAYAVSRAFAAGTTDAPAKKAKGRKPRLRTAA